MNEDILEEAPPSGKVYRIGIISIAAFVGGLLAGGYLIAENYRAFGKKKMARLTLVLSLIVSILVILPALFFYSKSPVLLYSALCSSLYALICSFFAQKLQGPLIESHLEKGGSEYPPARAILLSFPLAAITVLIITIILMLAGQPVISFLFHTPK